MAPPEEMGFKYIAEVQQRESRSQNLTKLPADFFDHLADHVERLRSIARDETAKDPMSTTAAMAQNELKNTLRLTEDIVLLRLRKMASRAVDSLEGGKVDLRTLTPREKDLYADLARFMARARDDLSRVGTGAARTLPRAPAEERPTAGDVINKSAPPEGGIERTARDEEEEEAAAPSGERLPDAKATGGSTLVHVLEDTPSFAGEGGRTYALRRGDMVSLPERLAQVLISRGVAERVD